MIEDEKFNNLIIEKEKLIQELKNKVEEQNVEIDKFEKIKVDLEEKFKKEELKNSNLEKSFNDLKIINELNLIKVTIYETIIKSYEEEIEYLNSNKNLDIDKIADLEFALSSLKTQIDNFEKEQVTLGVKNAEPEKNNTNLMITKNELGKKLRFSERIVELNKLNEIRNSNIKRNLEFSYSLPVNTPSCSTAKKASGLTFAEEVFIEENKEEKSELKTNDFFSLDKEPDDKYIKEIPTRTNPFSPIPPNRGYLPYIPFNPFPKTNNNVSPFYGKENERVEDWLYIVELVLEGNGVTQDKQKIIFASSYLRDAALHEYQSYIKDKDRNKILWEEFKNMLKDRYKRKDHELYERKIKKFKTSQRYLFLY